MPKKSTKSTQNTPASPSIPITAPTATVNSPNSPIAVEQQLKTNTTPDSTEIADDLTKRPDYPKDWRDKPIAEMVEKGFRYYRRPNKDGTKTTMSLRKADHERSLGDWTEEREIKLFGFYPKLETMGGIPKPPAHTPVPPGQTLMGIPIARPAVIPKDYQPSLNVLRYYAILRSNGYPHDFSRFINDIVRTHMEKCHGFSLPVVFVTEEGEQVVEADT